MSFLGNLFGKKATAPGVKEVITTKGSITTLNDTPTVSNVTGPTTTSTLNLSKHSAINLRKEKVNSICLTKAPISNLTARVVLALDYSGSMSDEYRSGLVQDTIERLFPIALKFDDDASMGVWMFENNFRKLPEMTLENYHDYVKKEIMRYGMGGTNYGGVINDICDTYIKKEPSNIPTYVIFITDGDCSDHRISEEAIKRAAKHNIFWQFVGLQDHRGYNRFDFLEKLDDMPGRFLDNADFFEIKDLKNMSDETLYGKLLNEFPNWVTAARKKGLVK
jgi:hypothetical protein